MWTQPPFARIACAVDGTEAALEGVLRALELTGPGTSITLIAVADGRGYSGNRGASLGPASARQALDDARWLARTNGVEALVDLRRGDDPCAVILERASDYDLLVLGGRGPLAAELLRRCPVPLLLARPLAHGAAFPDDLLVMPGAPEALAAKLSASPVRAQDERPPALVLAGPDREHVLALDASVLAVPAS